MTDNPIHFVLTVDAGDLEELAERQENEGDRHAALLEIMLMMRKRKRVNEMEDNE